MSGEPSALLYGPPAWEPVPNFTRLKILRRVAFFESASPLKRLELAQLSEGQVLEIASAHTRSIAGVRFVAVQLLAGGWEHVCPASSVQLLP